MKKLIRETEWLRVYSTDVGQHYESRLVSDKASVSSESVIQRWSSITSEERWEIALALQLRGTLESTLVPLVDFLVENGDSVVRSTLAPLLPMHPDKEKALNFLISQIREEKSHRANYFQALALVGDVSAVPPLTEICEEIQQEHGDYESMSIEQASDFIACCEALWKLTRADRFRLSIQRLAAHSNDTVRTMASLALRSH
jgi:HEAT repeat protein